MNMNELQWFQPFRIYAIDRITHDKRRERVESNVRRLKMSTARRHVQFSVRDGVVSAHVVRARFSCGETTVIETG